MSEIEKNQITYKKGDVIFREGDPGDFFYFIISGSVEIFRDYEGQKISLAVLEKTQAVGDLSILDKKVRSATAVARTAVTVIPVLPASMEEQLAQSPRWFQTIVALLVNRLRAADELIQRNRIAMPSAVVTTSPVPSAETTSASEPVPEPSLQLKSGETLFREGEPGGFFCFIVKGEVGIFRERAGKRVPLAKLEKHDVVGEMSVVDGKPRSATAEALTEVELMKITKKGFDDQLARQRRWFQAVIRTLVGHLRHADEVICRSGVQDDELVRRIRGGAPAFDDTKTKVSGKNAAEDESVTKVGGDGEDLIDKTETLVKGGADGGAPKLVRIESKHRSVLVCDPDPDFLAKVAEQLKKAGIGVLTCTAMDQAQMKLSNQKFGCVLLNLKMKKGSPEKLVRRIRYMQKKGDERLRVYMIAVDEDAYILEPFRKEIDGVFSPQLGAQVIAEHVAKMFHT